MSTDARPATEPVSTTDGAVAPAGDADPRPDLPRWEAGPNKLPLTISWREHIRDLWWFEDEDVRGAFDAYMGNHIAIWDKWVIASGPDQLELRARAARESGIAPGKIMIRYIPPRPTSERSGCGFDPTQTEERRERPGAAYDRPEDRSATVYHIPRPRLLVRLFVLPWEAIDRHLPDDLVADRKPEAILDTGAPLTVFPFRIWQPDRSHPIEKTG